MTPDPRIAAAKSLEELEQLMTFLPEDQYDPAQLPTFGGEDIERVPGLYSWDKTHVLAGDSPDNAYIQDRETWLKLGEG